MSPIEMKAILFTLLAFAGSLTAQAGPDKLGPRPTPTKHLNEHPDPATDKLSAGHWQMILMDRVSDTEKVLLYDLRALGKETDFGMDRWNAPTEEQFAPIQKDEDAYNQAVKDLAEY
jgi:hypothetical protein